MLHRASAIGDLGRYQLEAALQSAHVDHRRSGHADWQAVVRLYDALFELTRSPVVAINRTLAVAELHGPSAALEALPDSANDARLLEYQPYWAARADLLTRAARYSEARNAYEIAIGLERDPAVRGFLQRRQQALND